MIFVYLLLACVISIPIFWGTGDFNFRLFEGSLFVLLVLSVGYLILRRQLYFCLKEEFISIKYPFRLKDETTLIPYHQISIVMHEIEKHSAGFYESQDSIEIVLVESKKSFLLPIPKDTIWKKTRSLEKVLEIFEEKKCKIMRMSK
jgi:hypothetical protein